MKPIYVINLPYRTDRRCDTERELAKVGWEAEFFPAIRPSEAGGFPSIGARGAFLSHLAVLRLARDQGARRLVILEDDINFAPGLTDQWAQLAGFLESLDWSIFYAGHFLAGLGGLQKLPPEQVVMGGHFMVVNGPAIRRLVDGLETILSRPAGHPDGGPMHVDGAYSTLRRQDPHLITYAHFPALGYQRPSRTDIGEQKWFDRIGLLAHAVRFIGKARRFANSARPPY
jgi:glycosyl transferase, family 25